MFKELFEIIEEKKFRLFKILLKNFLNVFMKIFWVLKKNESFKKS